MLDFWAYHSNEGFKVNQFSDSFKELITDMLHPLPEYRISMADIIGHRWWTDGPTAAGQDITNEYVERD